MTIAARAMAEKKVFEQRSYLVATRRRPLSLPNMISICYLAAHVYMPEKTAASFVAALVIVYWCPPLLSAGDEGAYAFVLQRFSEPISVVPPTPEQPVRIRQAAEQYPCPDVIADLSGRDKKVDRAALAVTDGVELCIHVAFGAVDQAATPPFFAPRLDAVPLSHMPYRGLPSNRDRASSLSSFRRAERPGQPLSAQKCPYRSTASNDCKLYYWDRTLWAHRATVSHYGL